ncbi:cation channel family protein (macronuclear) [Tetrahymena thermophila SB210]|uniref:Cation channel family protein n=1 Tax=Tetrahymena thermophila (strain SB210) TaxID=312017 RepID=I7MMK2_TETTS|nr:cation channel family protein [Tetrahymena thermophila SB210]EAS05020.2 cation channel family protein [Tetrahymena thermophila SB210]|eukprot:XP_001025265.2 cation channel family protein [Tetrahymena thermophila SB210]
METQKTKSNFRSQKLQQIGQAALKLFKRIPIFDPSSHFKIFWDLIQLMINLVISIVIPFYVASGVQFNIIFPDYLVFLYKIMSIVDIIININTGYFEQGHYINDKLRILNNYLKSSFLIDLISLLPIFVHFHFVNGNTGTTDFSFGKLLLLLCLLKMTQFSRTFNKIQERILLTPNTTNFISLCKLLATMIFVCHLFACSWVLLGKIQINYNLNNQNWLTKANLQDQPIQNIYLHALYYSITTMSTVGYGDITPISEIELLWSLFSILMSSQMFAYSINTIGQLLREFSKKDQETQNKIYLINKYMIKKNVNKALKYQIREYLEYYWQENDIDDSKQQENIINQQLSKQLREQLLMDSNRIILKDSPIFKHNFSSNVITKTLNIIQQLTCTPEEKIFKRGDIQQQIFFIEKGEVDIIMEGEDEDKQKIYQKPKIISTLGKGKSFGMVGFFTGFSESYTVRSKEFCKLLFIKRQDFLEVLKEYQSDYEKFCYIKDNIMLYDNLDLIKKDCLSCLSTSHQLQFCPDTHYIPNKEHIIARFNHQNLKQRYEFERKNYSYKIKGINPEKFSILCFQNNNKDFLEDYYIKTYLPYSLRNEISFQNLEDAIQPNQNEMRNISQQNLTNNNLTKELDLQNQNQNSKLDKDDFKAPLQEIYSNIEQMDSSKKYFKSKLNVNDFSSEDQAEKSEFSFQQYKNTLNKIDSSQCIGSQQKIQDQNLKKIMSIPQIRGSFQIKSHRISQFRRKSIFNIKLPHKLSPQKVNQSALLGKRSSQFIEKQGFDQQGITTLQKHLQQSNSISTNQHCYKKNQISQQFTISDSLQKSYNLHSQTNPLQTTDQNIQKITDCLNKQIDQSNIITNSSRLNEFDDYEIQIEHEQNISQAQQLNVVFPSRQLEN